jgi:HNH endonuclease
MRGKKLRSPSTRKVGHRRMQIRGRRYRASRLAFLYMTGRWPKDEVNHVNGVHHDDRWKNLRDVTHQDNSVRRSFPTGSSSYLGVYPAGRRKFRKKGCKHGR